MVWGVSADLGLVNLYAEHLIDKCKQEEGDNSFRAMIRLLKGHTLLQEIFQLRITNIATVPVDKIVHFRKSNADLLASFLTEYRGFLVDILSEPEKIDLIVQKRTHAIVKEMDRLRSELLLLRNQRKYNWLRRLSKEAYDQANKKGYAAIWSLLMNPVLLVGSVGEILAKAALKLSDDLVDKRERENALLFRSSSGYLWKAHTQFHD